MWKLLAAVLCTATALVLFIGSCVVTMADGQGAFVFIISLPLSILLLTAAYLLKRGPATMVCPAFILVFTVSIFVPPFRAFPEAVVGAIGGVFQNIMGVSPYVWIKMKRPVVKQLNENLRGASAEVTVGMLDIGRPWLKLCAFGPYTSEEEAAKVLGFRSATMERSAARFSDDVVALVFLGENDGTLDVIDARRGAVDFLPVANACLPAALFPLKIVVDANGRKLVAKPAATP